MLINTMLSCWEKNTINASIDIEKYNSQKICKEKKHEKNPSWFIVCNTRPYGDKIWMGPRCRSKYSMYDKC